jgi:hypothetical protein
MTITLSDEVERALKDRAAKLGTTPEELANQALKRELMRYETTSPQPPHDDWERLLLSIPVETGVALTDEQVSRESLYED